jgi:CRISPR-associated protein Cas1
MGYSEESLALRIPDLKSLPRVTDRIPFFFIDKAKIEQTRTGIEAFKVIDEEKMRIPIPFANIASLILGPGCSITSPAMTTLYRHGTSIIQGSADGMSGYSQGRSLTSRSDWATAQARIHVDNRLRRDAAETLYRLRFIDPPPEGATIKKLRGIEGYIVRSAYTRLSKTHKVKDFYRNTKSEDPINIGLNLGNSILYGLALSVCSALSLSPSLGIVHHGANGAFLFDLADNFKLTTTIPAAFESNKEVDFISAVSKNVRNRLHEQDTLNRMFELAVTILEPAKLAFTTEDMLFDPEGDVEGHKNWTLE